MCAHTAACIIAAKIILKELSVPRLQSVEAKGISAPQLRPRLLPAQLQEPDNAPQPKPEELLGLDRPQVAPRRAGCHM